MHDVPAVARVREAQRRISARGQHDPERLVNYDLEMQERYKDRLLVESKRPTPPHTGEDG